MARSATIKAEKGKVQEAFKDFLSSLLEKGVVDAVIVPRALPSKDGFAQVLVLDPANLGETCMVAPTMPVQSARIISQLTARDMDRKVAAVLKPCEIRAAVELAKFLQIKTDNLYLIGVDCPGTFEVPDYSKMIQDGKDPEKITADIIKGMRTGKILPPEGITFRDACRMCEYPVPDADIVVRIFGYQEDEIGVEVGERLEKVLEEQEIVTLSGNNPAARDEVVSSVVREREEQRDSNFKEFRGKVKDLKSFLDYFSTCVRCHNCMTSCPICYCKECVFKTAVFEHDADRYFRWADRKKGIRMPTDTLLFHLIRMSHMVTSCVGCGLCDSACPSGLPVTTLFRSIGENVQKIFDYVPGKDIDEVPPVATFKEEELNIES